MSYWEPWKLAYRDRSAMFFVAVIIGFPLGLSLGQERWSYLLMLLLCDGVAAGVALSTTYALWRRWEKKSRT